MTIQLELWHLISICGGVIAFQTGVLAGFGKVLLDQIQKRIDDRFGAVHQLVDERTQAGNELRQASTASWQERHQQQMALVEVRDQTLKIEIDRLRADVTRLEAGYVAMQTHLAETYVSREIWLEHIGAVNTKLDNLARRLFENEH